jgi:hypothetical protein
MVTYILYLISSNDISYCSSSLTFTQEIFLCYTTTEQFLTLNADANILVILEILLQLLGLIDCS